MTPTITHSMPHLPPAKIAMAISFAAIVTLCLFAIMQKLISNTNVGTIPEPLPPIPVFVQDIKELSTTKKPRVLPTPKPLPIPQPTTKIQDQTPDDATLISKYVPDIAVGQQTLSLNTQFGMEDSQARPIVRMEPKYPPAAARDGIEGWVKLLFSIDSLGQVENIQVIESEPSNVFNREAKRALSKWKYKPQVIDGKPQAQDGLVVVLDFKLQQ